MPVTMSRGLGAIASQARGISSFSRHSFTVSNELRRAPTNSPISTTPCQRTLLSTSNPSSRSTQNPPRRPSQPLFRRHFFTKPEPPPKDGVQPEEEPYWNPHKAKRHWPPDMRKLSEKQQFRIERKYRRRAKLKFARPRWMKATKLAQWGAIAFTVIYAVLFLQWDENDKRGNPFEDVRRYFFDSINSVFTRPTSPKKQADDSTTTES